MGIQKQSIAMLHQNECRDIFTPLNASRHSRNIATQASSDCLSTICHEQSKMREKHPELGKFHVTCVEGDKPREEECYNISVWEEPLIQTFGIEPVV